MKKFLKMLLGICTVFDRKDYVPGSIALDSLKDLLKMQEELNYELSEVYIKRALTRSKLDKLLVLFQTVSDKRAKMLEPLLAKILDVYSYLDIWEDSVRINYEDTRKILANSTQLKFK